MVNTRLEKLENIPGEKYPRDFPGRETISEVLNCFADSKIIFKVAGRILSRRDHGNNIFFDLFDQTGSIQLHAQKLDIECITNDRGEDILTQNQYIEREIFNSASECDIGDMVGVEGTLGANPHGESLLQISNWTLLAKALIEPADKHNGLTNSEVKYRHRERDLLSSSNSRALFKTRAEIVFEIRKYLNDRDFIEIECPILQPIYGGATARPFKTKHNALGQDFFLSISSELYLKRAMVGGFDKVYSFSRCFRNEGISPTHNPEFTNLEVFETCKTSEDMQIFTDNLIEYAAHSVGSLVPPMRFDYFLPKSDWPLSRKYNNKCPNDTNNDYDCGRINCPFCGNLDFRYADAWELFSGGMEIASGASDLNDPHEQSERLIDTEFKSFENKQEEDHDPYDQNYIEALECGALPWAGVGIGIDRLVMLLAGLTNIRDAILFPTLKNKND